MDDDQIDTFLRRTTLRQIEVIAAMHEHATMTAASRALGMSVANVSRVTRRFEENTGLLLFSGLDRRIAPSADSSEILQAFGPLAQEILRLRALLRSGTIRSDKDGRGPRPPMQ